MNNEKEIKPFYDQFSECKRDGFLGKGEPRPFKDYPELLPSPFHKAAKIIAKKLEEDPNFGFDTIACLRFGGECCSGKIECKRLRGYK